MSLENLEYLANSLLFDQRYIDDQFQKVAEDDLKRELRNYRKFVLDNINVLEKTVLENSSNLKLFTGTTDPVLPLLKQTALYLDQVVIADPLFAVTHESSKTALTINKYIGMNDNSVNRVKLAKIVQYLKALIPMIAAGYVKLLPLTTVTEPPKDMPVRHSDNGFSDVLPESLLKFYRERVVVKSAKKFPEGLVIDGSFDIGRFIQVWFKDHDFNDSKGYILFEQVIDKVDRKNYTVESVMCIPETPPSKEEFEAWVSQSINQTAEHSFRRIIQETQMSAHYNANYLCNTPFEFDLMKQFFEGRESIQTHTINSILPFELPFMKNLDISTLMKVRLEDGEAFQNFRLELDKKFKELRLIKDPNELKIKTENAVHEIFEVQLAQVDQKMRQIKRVMKADIILASAGFVGAVQTGGLSLIAMAIALAHGAKSINEYYNQKEQNPSFFLWKLLT